MIYPKKLNAKKANLIMNIGIPVSAVIIAILFLLNKLYTPDLHWAALSTGGIIYAWITVLYSIKKNNNIANHVVLQTVALSSLAFFIDYKSGFKGWSINLAIPIIIIVANGTMFVLAIASRKKYIQYAICQLFIVVFSLLPLYFILANKTSNNVMSIIALGISGINLIISLALSFGAIKGAVERKFWM